MEFNDYFTNEKRLKALEEKVSKQEKLIQELIKKLAIKEMFEKEVLAKD